MNQSTAPVRLLVLEGDGIGPEITAAALRVLDALAPLHGVEFRLQRMDIGFAALKASGTTMPAPVLAAAKAADAVILGPVSHDEYPPTDQGGVNPSGVLRKELDLYANIRPAFTRPYIPSPIRREFDLVIVRENTEGFYADRTMFAGTGEFMPTPDLAMAMRKVTAQGSRRIAVSAFELARQRRKQERPRVTAVHKANVLRVSDGLFLAETRKVAAEFPEVAYDEKIVDAMTALLIRRPEEFDVIVTTNMFGDILSDEAGELTGSLGMAASLNAGADHGVAQAQHGSAPDIAGKGIANPVALIGSVAMLLRWLGQRKDAPSLVEAGKAMDAAMEKALENPQTRTRDLGGPLGTADFAAAIVASLKP